MATVQLLIVFITAYEIKFCIHILKNEKSPGHDEVTPMVIKHFSPKVVSVVTIVPCRGRHNPCFIKTFQEFIVVKYMKFFYNLKFVGRATKFKLGQKSVSLRLKL